MNILVLLSALTIFGYHLSFAEASSLHRRSKEVLCQKNIKNRKDFGKQGPKYVSHRDKAQYENQRRRVNKRPVTSESASTQLEPEVDLATLLMLASMTERD